MATQGCHKKIKEGDKGIQCASVYSIASPKGDDDERPTNSTLCDNVKLFIELSGD